MLGNPFYRSEGDFRKAFAGERNLPNIVHMYYIQVIKLIHLGGAAMDQSIVSGCWLVGITGVILGGIPLSHPVTANLSPLNAVPSRAIPSQPPVMRDAIAIALHPSVVPQGIPAAQTLHPCPDIQNHQVKLTPGHQADVELINQVAQQEQFVGQWCRSRLRQELRWVSNQPSEHQAVVVLKTFLNRGLDRSH